MWIGAHVTISKGLSGAVKLAHQMGGNTFQFFTRNPRGGSAKKLDPRDIAEAHELMAEYGFGPAVAHAPYTYNLASAKEEVREFTLRTLKDDVQRVKTMKVPYIILHVGTHGGQGEEKGLVLVIEGLREILEILEEDTYILLEGMAGEGSELGYTFEHLGIIIRESGSHPGLGICLDTCHMTGAGYDLADLEGLKKSIRDQVSLERIKAVHLNDSMHALGSRRDRHAKLGEGTLGLEIIKNLVRDPDFSRLPLILETPNDNAGYAREIAMIKEMCK